MFHDLSKFEIKKDITLGYLYVSYPSRKLMEQKIFGIVVGQIILIVLFKKFLGKMDCIANHQSLRMLLPERLKTNNCKNEQFFVIRYMERI